jgi:hypothetical protein
MATDNPSITASNLITDVEARLGNPNLSGTKYLPWISYAYQKVYHKLANVGQEVKEQLFGALETVTLTNGTAEYNLNDKISRYGGFIKAEIKYGGTSDEYKRATKLRSISQWNDQSQVTTSYQPKDKPLVYFLGTVFGVIPTPPADDAGTPYAKIWYVKRPYQITEVGDTIDIPYRFMFPLVNYVQAKAVQAKYEDYSASMALEKKFEDELEQMAEMAAGEMTENEGMGVEVDSSSPLYSNPLGNW